MNFPKEFKEALSHLPANEKDKLIFTYYDSEGVYKHHLEYCY